ncbi:hypothetical protein WN55_03683 [Dufourea novaeangliae]|uniref:Ionotropic glutamate receptor C-terminal domain-containing protein n=1 Tax=Dufourea novaeangliae TaxID=178035 RepID=A0A154PK58_DUFNO|nr:hypothetical protein WN55_03683 [Dufourea novaeangliae]
MSSEIRVLSHLVIPNRNNGTGLCAQSEKIRGNMNIIYLTILFALTAAETCVRFLKNADEKRIFHTVPGQIWRWNSVAQEFEEIQAVKLNGTAVCSVKMANNLRGKTIVVAADIMHPYIMRKSNDTAVTGFIGDIWTILEEFMGFKYALFVQSDGTEVLQQWYTNVFSQGVWLTILIFTLATVVVIIGVHYLVKITRTNHANHDEEFSSASFNLLVVLGSLSGQGCEKIPASWPLRLIVLSHLITGMLLSGGFSSTLTSYLAIRGKSVPLTSLEDALQKRSHSVCVRNDSSAYIHFTVVG